METIDKKQIEELEDKIEHTLDIILEHFKEMDERISEIESKIEELEDGIEKIVSG